MSWNNPSTLDKVHSTGSRDRIPCWMKWWTGYPILDPPFKSWKHISPSCFIVLCSLGLRFHCNQHLLSQSAFPPLVPRVWKTESSNLTVWASWSLWQPFKHGSGWCWVNCQICCIAPSVTSPVPCAISGEPETQQERGGETRRMDRRGKRGQPRTFSEVSNPPRVRWLDPEHTSVPHGVSPSTAPAVSSL